MKAWRSSGFQAFTPTWAQVAPGAPPAGPRTAQSPSGYAGVEDAAPPSSYAVVDVLEGRNGSLLRLGGLTLLRGAFLVPGLWLTKTVMGVDLDYKGLLALAFGGSVTISTFMIVFYWIKRRMS